MITVVGSLNMDFVFNTKVIPRPGETVLGSGFQQFPGGKGGNQAAAAARLGAEVTMIGAVGNDSIGEELIQALKKNRVKTDYIRKKDNSSSGIASIIVEASGNNAITVFSGANYSLVVEDVERYHFVIEKSNVLLVQLETPLLTVSKALRIAKHAECITILNPAPAMKLSGEILSCTDFLVPNETELELLSGCPATTMEEIQIAGNKLLKKGVHHLIVTLGIRGCVHIFKGGMKHYPAKKVKATDTTAAGDCFCGALAAAISEKCSIEEAIAFATAAATLSVTKPGAQASLPNRRDVDAFR